MICDDANMEDNKVKFMLQFDKEFNDLPFYKSEQLQIKRIEVGGLYTTLYNKIKNYDSFEDNLREIIKQKFKNRKLTEFEYNYISYCYFLALKNVYDKLRSIDKTSYKAIIEQINMSIIELLATFLDNYNYLHGLYCDNILTQNGKFKNITNENSLKHYNNTISSYNDFMTIYYMIISFLNDYCDEKCKNSSRILENITKLKENLTKINNKILSIMNERGKSFINKFAKVKQQPTQLKKNNRRRNNRRRNNTSSSATEQSDLPQQDISNSPKKSSCSIL